MDVAAKMVIEAAENADDAASMVIDAMEKTAVAALKQGEAWERHRNVADDECGAEIFKTNCECSGGSNLRLELWYW